MPANEAQIQKHAEAIRKLRDSLGGVLFGQTELIDLVLVGLLARGHLLLEGLPGLGKTELVKGLAKSLQLETKRIQFTPDLLPG
ncbi:MAG: AAA family ATPase, partial [Verrucomicrobiales bacterium]|nr:AAA family ATPase [Verrucomicrobiales bacterium]